MNRIRNCILAAVAVLGLVSVTAKAQTYASQSVSLTTTAITAGATSNLLHTLDVRRSENLALAIKFNCGTATNVLPLTIVLRKSLDGSNWSDKDTFSWSYIRDGTTNSIVASTNITTGGYGYFQIYTLANPGSAGQVNLESINYGVKNPSR